MTEHLQLIQTKLQHLARMQQYLAYSLGKPKGAYIAASTDMAVAVFLALWVAWRESRRHATGRAASPIVRQNQQMIKQAAARPMQTQINRHLSHQRSGAHSLASNFTHN